MSAPARPAGGPFSDRRAETTTPRILVVVNSPSSGPRRLADWLASGGAFLDVRNGDDGLPETLAGYDGLVLLGGGLLPTDDERAPWLARERELAAEAIREDLPTLGICLGGQLLAEVAGGVVEPHSGEPERGSTVVEVVTSGAGAVPAGDALFAGLPARFPVIENHQDAITALPPGAIHLARSRRCRNQAFRLGSRVWGLQFHPEVPASVLDGWDAGDLAREGLDHRELVREARRNEPVTEPVCHELVQRFLGVVRA